MRPSPKTDRNLAHASAIYNTLPLNPGGYTPFLAKFHPLNKEIGIKFVIDTKVQLTLHEDQIKKPIFYFCCYKLSMYRTFRMRQKQLGPRRLGNGVTLILCLCAPYIGKSIEDLEIKYSLMLDIKHT